MKMTTTILLFIIMALVIYIVRNRPAPPVPDYAYQGIIDSLEKQISVIEIFLDLQKEKRDSLEKAGIQITTVQHTVLKEVATYSPKQALHYFDSITPGTTPSQITEQGIITEQTRIQAANLSITETKFLHAQNHNMTLIIESLDAQIDNAQEIRQLEQRKYTECETHRQELQQDNETLRKKLKWANRLATGAGIVALIAIVI